MKPLIAKGALLILLVFSLFSSLNIIELTSSEPLRAAISLEMLINKEYILPHLNGMLYINKPPLFNWAQAATSFIFNSTQPWVWRLPGILALLLTGLGTYLFIKNPLGKQTAFFAALFSMTAGDLFFFGAVRAGEIDIFLMFLVFGQLTTLYQAFVSNRFHWFLLSFAFLAAGVLTKVIPFYLQLTAILAIVASNRSAKWLFSWKHWVGWLCFIGIAGWYVYLYSLSEDPIVLLGNFGAEASSKTAIGKPWGKIVESMLKFPIDILFRLIFPWSLFLILLLKKGRWKLLWQNSLIRFCGYFILISIPVFWINPELRVRYLYLFVPFFAIIAAQSVALFFDHKNDYWSSVLHFIFKKVFFVLPLLLLFSPWLLTHNFFIDQMILTIVLPIIALFLLWVYTRTDFPKALLLVGAMVLIRIDSNYIYLPYQEAKSPKHIYYEQVDKLIDLTQGEPLHYVAVTETRYAMESYLGQSHPYTYIYQIPNQFLYRYAQKTGRVLQFHKNPKANHLYFTKEKLLKNKPIERLYSFKFKWGHEWNMTLFRAKESFNLVE